jgi:octaprenyl-diphosphate synthase
MLAAERKAARVAVSTSDPDPNLSWRKIVEPVEPFLELVARRLGEQVETFEPEIAPYAQYALTNQGKQLRPALVALSAGAVGNTGPDLVTAAVIIEMVHLATLVHDDIMDEAAIRRRRPTLAANWGNQISVLLGDCLFAHALRLAAGFPTTEVCRAVSSATKTVCSGEILQTNRQGSLEISRAEYFKILQMKTAELFALSCDLGAWLGGANARERKALRGFGLALGTAYQVYDDCLDIFGLEAVAGKSLGTDLANGKLTLPVLVALERAGPGDALRLKELVSPWDGHQAGELLDLLERGGALAESRAVIHDFLETARQSLQGVRETGSRKALMGLTWFVAQQTDALGVKP